MALARLARGLSGDRPDVLIARVDPDDASRSEVRGASARFSGAGGTERQSQ
jgi:hypothetical protein